MFLLLGTKVSFSGSEGANLIQSFMFCLSLKEARYHKTTWVDLGFYCKIIELSHQEDMV